MAALFFASSAAGFDFAPFLLFGLDLNRRVSSLVVTTLRVVAGSKGGEGGEGGKLAATGGGGVWLRCDEPLEVGVLERFVAATGGVQEIVGGGGFAAAVPVEAEADRDLLLVLFFLPRPAFLLFASFEDVAGGITVCDDTWLVVPFASLQTFLFFKKIII